MADIDRHELHPLVDHIAESDVPAARKVLRALADPVELAMLAAPPDDEPETEDEKQGAAEARDWIARRGGKGIPHSDAMRSLGLTEPL